MTFPLRFLICNLFLAILLGILLSVKHLWKKHLTCRAQYGLWYVFTMALWIPLLPYRTASPWKLFLLLSRFLRPASAKQLSTTAMGGTAPVLGTDVWLQDFSAAVSSASGPLATRILWGIWISGGCAAALYFAYNVFRIFLLRKNAFLVTAQNEPELYGQYSLCLEKLHIRRSIALYASCHLSSPVSYGLFRPKIIIPQDLDIRMTDKEVYYIFLHELQHYRHKDAFLNGLSCILQIIYWFNPLIWYGFRQMQKDRELACDSAVMEVIGTEERAGYGLTLIRYAEIMRNGAFLSPLSNMGGTKKLIRQRITAIAAYRSASAKQKAKSGLLITLTAALVLCASPLFSAQAFSAASFHLADESWDTLDASPYFEGREGTFVLYDMTSKQYHIYNKELSEQRVSPDSTYKIYSALAALEEHLISPTASLQKWDGTAQMYDAWNHDQTLTSAMQNSVNWYFQNLDSGLGLSTLGSYFRRFSYGNCDLSGGIEAYWAESSLKISPVEQVNSLAGLWENKWELEPRNIQAVKDALFLSELPVGKLYGKTGTGNVGGQNCNAWFVGFLESGDHVYCFAANLRGEANADGSTAAQITIDILNHIL